MNRVERLEKALEVALHTIRSNNYRSVLEKIENILTPSPAYEDVEADGWAVYAVCSNKPLGLFPSKETAEAAALAYGIDHYIVYVNGPARRPLPSPVEKMTHGIAAGGSVVLDIGEQPPKGTPCVVLWEEGGAGKTVGGSAKKSVTVDAALTNMGNLMCARVFKNHKEFHGKKGTLTFTVQEDQ